MNLPNMGADPRTGIGAPSSPASIVPVLWTTSIGAIGLLAAYLGASASAKVSTQLAWTAVAVVAVVVAGIGNATWLAAGSRAVRIRTRLTFERLDCNPGYTGSSIVSTVPPGNEEDAGLVSGPGMARYHRPDCLMVAGKAARPATAARHRAGGRQACGVCLPEEDETGRRC